MNIILRIILGALAVIVAAYILPGVFVDNPFTAIVVAIVLSLLNAFIKPLLIVLTLPVNILTLGLFTVVINAALVMLASAITPGFVVDSFVWALLFSIFLALINGILTLPAAGAQPMQRHRPIGPD